MELYRFNHNAKTGTFDELYDALNAFRGHVQGQIKNNAKSTEFGDIESYLAAELESLNNFLQRDNFDTIQFKKEWTETSALDSLYFFRISNAIYFKGLREITTAEWSQMRTSNSDEKSNFLPLKKNFWNKQPEFFYDSDFDNQASEIMLHVRTTYFCVSEEFVNSKLGETMSIGGDRFYYNASLTNQRIIVEVYKISDALYSLSGGKIKKEGCF